MLAKHSCADCGSTRVAVQAVTGLELAGLGSELQPCGVACATEAQHAACDSSLLCTLVAYSHVKLCPALGAACAPGVARFWRRRHNPVVRPANPDLHRVCSLPGHPASPTPRMHMKLGTGLHHTILHTLLDYLWPIKLPWVQFSIGLYMVPQHSGGCMCHETQHAACVVYS